MRRVALDAGLRIHSLDAALGVKPQAVPAVPAEDPREALARERERVLQQAREQGRAEGLAEAARERAEALEAAREEARQEHADATAALRDTEQRLAALIARLSAQAETFAEDMEPLAIEAAFAAALRVIDAVAPDEALVQGVCRAALAEYRQRPAVLKVAPDDLAAVQPLAEAGAQGVVVEADPRLGPGECRVEARKAAYASSLDARLEALRQAFLAARAAPRESSP